MCGLEDNLKKIWRTTVPVHKIKIIAFCISLMVLVTNYITAQWLILKIEEKNFVQELQIHTKEYLAYAKLLFDGITEDLQMKFKNMMIYGPRKYKKSWSFHTI